MSYVSFGLSVISYCQTRLAIVVRSPTLLDIFVGVLCAMGGQTASPTSPFAAQLENLGDEVDV